MSGGLREKTLKGFVWNAMGSIGVGLMNLLVTMFLARILTPADFGIIELLIIFTSISNVFVDSGFSQALIRDKQVSNTDYSSVFYLNLIIASGIYLILFLLSPFISEYFLEPRLQSLSRIVFLSIPFNALGLVQNVKFTRTMDFKKPAIISFSSVVVAGGISIFLALNGFGIWALVSNLVLYSFFNMLFLWVVSDWRPKLCMAKQSLLKYFAFGSNILIQSIVDKIVTNLESLFIGRIYSKQQLGYFSQARKLDSYMTQSLLSVVQKVTYPALSKLDSNSNELKVSYQKVVGLTMYIICPITFLVFFSSDIFLELMFGSQWIPASPYLKYWLICGLAVSLYTVFTNAFLVLGDSRKLLKVSLLRQFFRVITVALLVKISIIVLLQGITLTTIVFGGVYIYVGGKLLKYTMLELFKDLYKVFTSSIISGFIVSVIGIYLTTFISSILLVFSLQVILMSILQVLILKTIRDKNQILFFEVLKTLLKKQF